MQLDSNPGTHLPGTLDIKKTRDTPKIKYDPGMHLFFIKGRSIPEDHAAFYEPVLHWIDEFSLSPPTQLSVKVELEYFNTSSSKYLMKIFKKQEQIHKQFHNVQMEWRFEEDEYDMKECGEDYSSILSFPFDMVEIPGG